MIKVNGITKYYGEKKAVDNASFEIQPGEIVGFLGPNGAGKTTILKIMTGILHPTAGSVSIFGHDIAESPVEAKKKIGYLSENNPLYPDYTPAQYLDFIARVRQIENPGQNISQVMEKVFIADVANTKIAKLSKGYRQRVGLAAALLAKPDVLLLDEPTVGLDPNQIRDIRTLIREIGKTQTIFLSTHILQEVTSVCSRVIIIHNGTIVASDTLSNLSHHLDKAERTVFTFKGRSDHAVAELKKIPGVTEVECEHCDDHVNRVTVWSKKDEEIRPEAAKMLVKEGFEIYGISRERLSLEEVFKKLTAETGNE